MMQEVSRTTQRIPANYRIGLALSTAILLHTLLLSGFPSPIQQPDDTRHRVRIELISPGSEASSALAPTTASAVPESRNPRFEVAPESTASTSELTASDSARKITAPEPDLQEQPAEVQRKQPGDGATVSASVPAPETRASTETRAGSQLPEIESESDANLTQVTESPSEQDPYLITLAVHLSHELQRLRVPAISQLSEKVAMEIELQLLENGALTRARILKSTGIKNIDEAAYRASLAASPYPEPPAENDSQNRFEVELVFSPKRL